MGGGGLAFFFGGGGKFAHDRDSSKRPAASAMQDKKGNEVVCQARAIRAFKLEGYPTGKILGALKSTQLNLGQW